MEKKRLKAAQLDVSTSLTYVHTKLASSASRTVSALCVLTARTLPMFAKLILHSFSYLCYNIPLLIFGTNLEAVNSVSSQSTSRQNINFFKEDETIGENPPEETLRKCLTKRSCMLFWTYTEQKAQLLYIKKT